MRTETWKCARETRGARTFALVLMVLGAVAAPLAGQTPTNHLYDKLQIGASFTNVILGSTIRVDGSQGNGTDVDAEDDLGLSKRCYAIDMGRTGLRLLYMDGQRMKKHAPARPYDRYVMYNGITTTCVMIAKQLNTSGVYDIA